MSASSCSPIIEEHEEQRRAFAQGGEGSNAFIEVDRDDFFNKCTQN
jgi:hypothetical protein